MQFRYNWIEKLKCDKNVETLYSLRARDGFIQAIFYKRFDCFSL